MTVEWNELPETHDLLGGPFHGTRVVMHHPRSMYFAIVDGDNAPRVTAYRRTCYWREGQKHWQYVFAPERSHRSFGDTNASGNTMTWGNTMTPRREPAPPLAAEGDVASNTT